MAGRASRWDQVRVHQRTRENGTEDASGKEERPRGAAMVERATAGRNKRLEHYLKTGSSAERPEEELSRLLDIQAAERAPRERWLRDILDACED